MENPLSIHAINNKKAKHFKKGNKRKTFSEIFEDVISIPLPPLGKTKKGGKRTYDSKQKRSSNK